MLSYNNFIYEGSTIPDKDVLVMVKPNTDDDYRILSNAVAIKRKENGMFLDFVILYTGKLYKPDGLVGSRCYYVGYDFVSYLKPNKNLNDKSVKSTNRLKKILNTDIISNKFVNYLDISTDKIDTITFLPNNRKTIKNPYNSRYRQEMKIGRFIKNNCMYDIPQVAIEKISNVYKSTMDAINNKTDMEIVSGKNIKKWYLKSNYDEGKGTLNKSCMRYKKSQKRFKIYVDNCKMVIKRSPTNKNKIVGRALLWNTNRGKYMDRVYVTQDHHLHSFIGLAEKNNWLTYHNNNKQLIVQLNRGVFYGDETNNPYMDTFKYYYPRDNILTNKDIDNNEEYYYLEDFD